MQSIIKTSEATLNNYMRNQLQTKLLSCLDLKPESQLFFPLTTNQAAQPLLLRECLHKINSEMCTTHYSMLTKLDPQTRQQLFFQMLVKTYSN